MGLWLEILGIDSNEVSCDHNSNAPLSYLNDKGENNEGEENSYWKYFLTSEERNNFLKYVDSCNNKKKNNSLIGNKNVITSIIQDKLINIGLLNIIETKIKLPNKTRSLLLLHGKKNNNSSSLLGINNMVDDNSSIATNMNAYDDIMYDDIHHYDHYIDNNDKIEKYSYHYDPDDIQMDNYDHQEEKQEEHESENRITINTQNFHVCCNEGYDSYILYYYLLKSYRKDGGIWIKEETEEDGDEELSNHNNISNSYILFDEIISNACIRKYYKKIEKSNDSYDYYSFRNNESIDRFHRSSNHSSRIEYLSFSNSFNNNSQLNFHNNDSDEAVEDEYYWISPSIENLFTSSPSSISTTIKLNLKIKEKEDEETIEDIINKLKEEYDILLYIFQMLPMHLLKCNKIKKVKDYCFHSSNFIHGRLLFSMMIQLQSSSSSSGVGVMECIKLIKNEWFLYLLIYNNEKERQNNMKNRKNNADYSDDSKDPYITIISIFTKIRQFLLTEFPIKNNSNNSVNQVIMDNESTSKKEYYEVGKALETLAST